MLYGIYYNRYVLNKKFILLLFLALVIAYLTRFICDSYSLGGGNCGQPLHFTGTRANFIDFKLLPLLLDFVIFFVLFSLAYQFLFKSKPLKLYIAAFITVILSIFLVAGLFFVLLFVFAMLISSYFPVAGFGGVAAVMTFSYAGGLIGGPLLFLILAPFVLRLFYKVKLSLSIKRLKYLPVLIVGEILSGGIGVWIASGVIDPIFQKGEYSFSAFFLTVALVFIPFSVAVLEKILVELNVTNTVFEAKKF